MTLVSSAIDAKKADFVTLIAIATQLFNEKYFVGKTQEWGNVTSEVAKNAERQFNDPKDAAYGSATFASTIKALTGEEIKLRRPSTVQYLVGVAVVPVAPLYGERTDDGYTLGAAYLCTNESSGGKFRNADNIGARMTNGSHNQLKLMSPFSDEVRPATEEEIVALVDALLNSKGLSLLQDLSPELTERYSHFIK